MNSDVSQPGMGNSRFNWIGLFFLAAGVLLLLSKIGYDVPEWIFTWPVFIICVGFLIGVRRQFKSVTSFILMLIGGLFLARNQGWIPANMKIFFWPCLLIIIGLRIIFRPKLFNIKSYKYSNFQDVTNEQQSDNNESHQ